MYVVVARFKPSESPYINAQKGRETGVAVFCDNFGDAKELALSYQNLSPYDAVRIYEHFQRPNISDDPFGDRKA